MITRQELEARFAALGYKVEPGSLDDIYTALPLLEAMQARIRRAFRQSDEPAHRFDAEER